MSIAPQRYKFKNETTNVPTVDFRTIKDNKVINDKEKEDNNANGLAGLASSAGGALGKLASGLKSVVNNVKGKLNGLKQLANKVKGVVNQVKGVYNKVKDVYNKAKNVYNAAKNIGASIQRFCKDPSLSSLSGISGSLNSFAGSVGGLNLSVASNLSNAVGGVIGDAVSAVGSIGNGVVNYVSNGLKTVGSSIGESLGGIGEWVSNATGGAGVLNTIKEAAGEVENTFGVIYKTASDLKIPGVLTGSTSGDVSLADLTGMSKAAAKVYGATSMVKGSVEFIETSKSKLADTFKSFLPDVSTQVATKASYTDPNTTIANNGSSIIMDVQNALDSKSYVSNDGKLSTKTSDGSNSEWSLLTWSSNSSSTATTDPDTGVVSGTTNNEIVKAAEVSKRDYHKEKYGVSTTDVNDVTDEQLEEWRSCFGAYDDSLTKEGVLRIRKQLIEEEERLEAKRAENRARREAYEAKQKLEEKANKTASSDSDVGRRMLYD